MKQTIKDVIEVWHGDYNGLPIRTKWTTSRGYETYGYNICSLYIGQKKCFSCNGGGYDMEGTVIADMMKALFPKELLKLAKKGGFYGLQEYEGSFILDGACGKSSMERILKEFGYNLDYLNLGIKDVNVYRLEKI